MALFIINKNQRCYISWHQWAISAASTNSQEVHGSADFGLKRTALSTITFTKTLKVSNTCSATIWPMRIVLNSLVCTLLTTVQMAWPCSQVCIWPLRWFLEINISISLHQDGEFALGSVLHGASNHFLTHGMLRLMDQLLVLTSENTMLMVLLIRLRFKIASVNSTKLIPVNTWATLMKTCPTVTQTMVHNQMVRLKMPAGFKLWTSSSLVKVTTTSRRTQSS